MPMASVKYARVPEAMCKGRNRYMQTGGIDVYEGADDTIYLEPRTSKYAGSDACRIVVPKESIRMVMGALAAQLPQEVTTVSPAVRIARLVARLTRRPTLVENIITATHGLQNSKVD